MSPVAQVTLRIRFVDRPDYELAIESACRDADPWELLEAQADRSGRIPLGDRESCTIAEVRDVTRVEPTFVEGPGWRRGLQDEDVSTALDENYEPPG